jgi:hypothetical protein
MNKHIQDIKSLATAKKLYPELITELVRLCDEIYNDIAMDGFGINGARTKAEYVSVLGDHVHWATGPDGNGYEISSTARSFFRNRCTYRTQKQIVGSAFLG